MEKLKVMRDGDERYFNLIKDVLKSTIQPIHMIVPAGTPVTEEMVHAQVNIYATLSTVVSLANIYEVWANTLLTGDVVVSDMDVDLLVRTYKSMIIKNVETVTNSCKLLFDENVATSMAFSLGYILSMFTKYEKELFVNGVPVYNQTNELHSAARDLQPELQKIVWTYLGGLRMYNIDVDKMQSKSK